MTMFPNAHDATTIPVLLAVNRCVDICLERQDGCTRAAEAFSATGLKGLLADFAEERGLQALAFLSITESLGRRFRSTTRMRRWSGSRVRSDRSVLDECIVGDEASRVELEVVFTWAPLVAMPMGVRVLMLSTYAGTLRLLSELRGQLAAA
jgi:hypothetical protein